MKLRGCQLLVSLLLAATGCEALIGLRDRSLADGGLAGEGGPRASDTQCQRYCERVSDTCRDQYAVYPNDDDASCLAVCALWTEDQVSCRDEEAQKAASSREFWEYCQGAGPGGSTACGDNCQSYCEIMQQACEMPEREEDVETCVQKCGVLRDRERNLRGLPANTSRFDVRKDHEQDTLQCRLVHATIAVVSPEDHCWHAAIAPHAGDDGVPNPCATGLAETAPHCEDYCHVIKGACADADAVYESDAQCMATCQALELGAVSDDAGKDTVGCRKTHAYNALVTQMYGTHCPHSGPGGAGVCGEDCGAYCRLLQRGCAGPFEAEFGQGASAATSCESACQTLRGDSPLRYAAGSAESDANPLACRLLYATRALEKPSQAAEFCPSALGQGACD